MLTALVLYAGAALLVGGFYVRSLLFAGGVPLRLLGLGFGLLALGAALRVMSTLSSLDALTADNLLTYLTEVAAGRAALTLLLGATLLLVSEITHFSRLTSLGAAGLTLWGLAGMGHGATHGPFVHFLHVLHAAAMCVWLGGVVALALRPATPADAARFSPYALVAALTLPITGLLMTLNHAGASLSLFQSDYGQKLLLKLCLAALLLPAVWASRRAFARHRRVRLFLLLETALFVLVLLVTAQLTQLPPPSHNPLPTPTSIQQ